MGVYERDDSPFFWLLLEQQGRKPKREATKIPKDGGSPAAKKELRRQAQELYATRMVQLSRGRHGQHVDTEERTFQQHREWYQEHVTAQKRGKVRELSMLRQLAPFFDKYNLSDIDAELAREWRTWRLKDVSASTVRREEAILNHLLATAVPKYLEKNALAGLKRLRGAVTDTRILSDGEETRLLKALRTDEDYALIVGALDTLLRLSNIANLKRKQDHGGHLFSDTKVGAVRIPISQRFRRALNKLPTSKHGDAPYFPSYAGKGNNPVINMFMDACRRANVQTGRTTGGVSFHCLRHTGASRMLAAGVDVKTVMEIGGWKNLKVMERYLHPTDERKRAAVNAIARRRPRR